ncbi:uncharacterized protein LOC125209796 [Salvia hispanica]|uniref:uncharacterized protein LOC125209796 n=1 Tax=Salvia hispanica TaxID=49212 RepID=UPI00200963C2|nr:uncharacterized protein LOC125209796 [Salvia hispanica]
METEGGPSKFTRAVSTRTLTDVIHDDPDDDDPKEELRGWKHFKEKIRSQGRHAGSGAAWTSSVSVPASDVPVQTSQKRVMFRHPSGRVSAAPESDPGMLQGAEIGAVQQEFLRRNSSGRNERSGRFDSDPSPLRRLQEEEAADEEGEEAPAKMSLMSLLAENDDEYGMGEDEDEEEDEEEDGGGANTNCSICMVRHKGAAFDPCGHSFCRLCSREMWVQGGNCPLCIFCFINA